MRQYSFVSVPIVRRREGLEFETDYQDVIRKRAASGWTFVQAIPLEGHINPRLDLVFTRKDRS